MQKSLITVRQFIHNHRLATLVIGVTIATSIGGGVFAAYHYTTTQNTASKTAEKQSSPLASPDSTQKPSPRSSDAQQNSTHGSTKKGSSAQTAKPNGTPEPSKPTQTNPKSPLTPPTPKPTTPAGPQYPSGQAVPRGDIGVWKQIFYDDFTRDAPLGSFGEDWDGDKIVYTGAQGQQWRAYPKSYKDTYDKRPYRSDAVLSVKNSMLNFWLHSVDGVPAGANPSPLIGSASQYQTYGRYSARFKVDAPNLNEYYVAWLLWPQSENWPDDGEFDFPEGSLAGNVGGFHHYAGADSYGSCRPNCQESASIPANTKFTDWHTYTIEWSPGRVKYLLDGVVVLDSTKGVPSTPMRWQLQTETKGNGTSSGNLMVDWVAVWKYQP